MAKQTRSLIGGMTVLGMTGILCKLIGVLFSVPLTWIIGSRGLSVFQGVFPTYNLLLTISSAGLPVAVSRMVSHCLAKDDPRGAKHVFRAALYLLAAMGAFCTLLMVASNGLLVSLVGQPNASAGFYAIAPCVAIVCVLSAFRGFMQGQQNMVPTAISQLIEQVGKVLISLPLAYLGYRYGTELGLAQATAQALTGEAAQELQTQMAAAYGATGALLGITLVEALALGYMVLLYLRRRAAFDQIAQLGEAELLTSRSVAGRLLRISIPITIGACIVPLAQFVDSALLVKRMLAAGLSQAEAQTLYGLFSGLVIRLINIPTALALSISMSLVPAISACKAVGDDEGVRKQAGLGLRFAFLIGFPCSIGMSVLAEPIMRFFYEGSLSAEELRAGAELLTMSSLTVVLFTVVQATSAILQGIGKQKIPMLTLCVGVGFKIVLNYVLVGTPGIDIHGGPIASIVCYSASMLPNLYYCVKHTRMRFDWKAIVLKPAAATAVMGMAVWGLRELLPSHRLLTLLTIAVGVAVYAGAALLLGAFTKDDIAPLLRRRKRG